jgi:predicted GNAT family acetyltransferase
VTALVNNKKAHRYEMTLGGGVAFADYRKTGNVLTITHVEVPPALEGRGFAAQLMKAILEDIRAKGEKVIPVCSYAVAYMRRHPDQQDLLGR